MKKLLARQAKGGKAKTAAKKAAARANGKLGGRPRNADRRSEPHLFVGHFGFDGTKADGTETEDTRFTAVIEATDINAAVRGFRRLLSQPQIRQGIGEYPVDLLSCSEIKAMPATGFVTFYEIIMRDGAENTGGICGAGLGLPSGQQGIIHYSHTRPFIKGRGRAG